MTSRFLTHALFSAVSAASLAGGLMLLNAGASRGSHPTHSWASSPSPVVANGEHGTHSSLFDGKPALPSGSQQRH